MEQEQLRLRLSRSRQLLGPEKGNLLTTTNFFISSAITIHVLALKNWNSDFDFVTYTEVLGILHIYYNFIPFVVCLPKVA